MPADVVSCIACGELPRPDHRFCVHCGVPIEGNGLVSDGAWSGGDQNPDGELGTGSGRRPADGKQVVIVGSGTRDERSSARSTESRTSVARLTTGLVALLVVGVGYLLFAPATESVTGVGEMLHAIDRRVPPDWVTPSGTGRADLTLPLPATSSGEPAGRQEPADVSRPYRPVPALADMELLAGTAGGLVRVDLSTLEQELVPIPGLVVAASNHRLVMNVRGVGLVAAPLADPDDMTILVEVEGTAVDQAVIDNDGRLLVTYWSPGGDDPVTNTAAFDLDSGEQVGTFDELLGWSVAPGLYWLAGLGTYVTDGGDSTRLLSDGFPLVAGQRAVLIIRCDDPGSCERYWIDRATGERLDRHIPDRINPASFPIGPADRFLFVVEPDFGYFDVETGDHVPVPTESSPFETGFGRQRVEITSDDGRFLFVLGRAAVFVYDTEDGRYSRIDLDVDWRPTFIGLLARQSGGAEVRAGG
jgi:hypothetical protein